MRTTAPIEIRPEQLLRLVDFIEGVTKMQYIKNIYESRIIDEVIAESINSGLCGSALYYVGIIRVYAAVHHTTMYMVV